MITHFIYRAGGNANKLLACLALALPGLSHAEINTPPEQLIADPLSANEIRLTWKAPQDGENIKGYRIFRDGKRIANTRATSYIDDTLTAATEYTYYVLAFDEDKNKTGTSNKDSAKTLVNNVNDGLRNGSVLTGIGMRLREVCGVGSISEVPAENLDACLDTVIAGYRLKSGVEDLRAFVARLRRQEDPLLIDLGMRLFHSKSLSQNNDTACSSCHHPAVGCGGDGLSLPIGVDAQNPDLLGPGRSDGETLPSVPRHSQHICNSALWLESMFWDQRISLQESNRETPTGTVSTAAIRTPERDVTESMLEVNSSDPLRLLIAQAHFPVTAAAEMGDPSGFASPQVYRQYIADKLKPDWSEKFNQAFGSQEIDFMRISRALAAYEAKHLFINNPFFDYVDGNRDSLSEDEKRGALFFYAGSGCANCHDGVLFTPEATRGPLYPQIGVSSSGDGNDKGQFRMPSLLNVGLTAPYGDKGAFPTLERVIKHYENTRQSIASFYQNSEVCELEQFKHLSESQCREIEGEGQAYSEQFFLERQEQRGGGEDDSGQEPTEPVQGFTQDEVTYLVAFLNSLTDKDALPGSHKIQALIPPRDGGPDGRQLDAVDKDGKAL